MTTLLLIFECIPNHEQLFLVSNHCRLSLCRNGGENHVEKRVKDDGGRCFEGVEGLGARIVRQEALAHWRLKTAMEKPLPVHPRRNPARINARQRWGRSRCCRHCRAPCCGAASGAARKTHPARGGKGSPRRCEQLVKLKKRGVAESGRSKKTMAFGDSRAIKGANWEQDCQSVATPGEHTPGSGTL